MKNDVQVELYYSGGWQNITALDHVYTLEPIRITRGRPEQSTRKAVAPPATCTLAIKNTDGRYSIRNRTSPLYGLIGRNTPIRVSCNGSVRFVGEIESWPTRWTVTGAVVWSPVTARGLLHRLNAPGTSAPASTALQRLVGFGAGLSLTPAVAFWPMRSPASHDQTAPEMRVADTTGSASPDLSWQTAKISSALGDTFTSSARDIYVRPRSPVNLATDVTVDSVVAARPSGDTSSFTLSNRVGAFFVNVICSWVTGVPTMTLTTNTGTLDTAAAADATAVWDQAAHTFRVRLVQNGANIDATAYLDGVEIMSGSAASTALASTAKFLPGLITAARADILWSHVAVWSIDEPVATDVATAAAGYPGETALERLQELTTTAGITLTAVEHTAIDSALVGIERPVPLVEKFADAAEADGGTLFDTRDGLGLTYRTNASHYNQTAVLELDYAAGGEVAPPLEPVPDTDDVANDVTVTRFDGGSAQSVQETGPLNVQEPPDGVGRYDVDETLVLYADGQCLQHAAWIRHLGTWDEERYPSVQLDLTAMHAEGRTALMADAAALDVGQRFTIARPPPWLGVAGVELSLLAEGFTEDIETHRWLIRVNASPEGPWRVGVLDDADTGRLDCNGSTLTAAIAAGATSFQVTITDSCLWSTTAEPYDVVVAGDVMTATAVSGTSSPQTFTVVRGPGARAHAAGTELHIARPFRLAR
jgi:hypothetical protein